MQARRVAAARHASMRTPAILVGIAADRFVPLELLRDNAASRMNPPKTRVHNFASYDADCTADAACICEATVASTGCTLRLRCDHRPHMCCPSSNAAGAPYVHH